MIPWLFPIAVFLGCLFLMPPLEFPAGVIGAWLNQRAAHKTLRIVERAEPWGARFVREFRETFPGRCMICSMADFARGMGWEEIAHPHDCIERGRASR